MPWLLASPGNQHQWHWLYVLVFCESECWQNATFPWRRMRENAKILLCLLNYLYHVKCLTHWGRVTHICVCNLTIIGSDNGLSPGRRQAITWTNVGILLIGPLGTNFGEMLIEIHTFPFKKIHLKMSSGKWRPFCLGLNVLNICTNCDIGKPNLVYYMFQGPWPGGLQVFNRKQTRRFDRLTSSGTAINNNNLNTRMYADQEHKEQIIDASHKSP